MSVFTQTRPVFNHVIARLTESKGYPPSPYQVDIYREVYDPNSGHLVIVAVAGSGKTTTIMDSLLFLPEMTRNVVVAFNKHIADELNSRGLPDHTSAATLHSVCFAAIKQAQPRDCKIKVDQWKTWDILRSVLHDLDADEDPKEISSPIAKLIGLFKAQGLGNVSHEMVEYLVDRYDMDWEPEWYRYLEAVYDQSMEMRHVVDFDDMLLFALDPAVKFPKWNNIFIDESQDLNPIQIELLAKMGRVESSKPSRLIFVGDPRQSIYGFRGADPRAIAEIQERFQPKSLPLSISWRCCRAVIDRARNIVPQIEAAPNAIEGEIIQTDEETFTDLLRDGDYVLCRTTAPLVGWCMRLLAAKRKAVVLGKDIGKGLERILTEIDKAGYVSRMSIGDALSVWENTQFAKIKGDDPRSDMKRARISDKVHALRAICEDCETIDEGKQKISELFADQSKGITFSTVHKAKGLEADRIFILRPDLMPFPFAKAEWEREQEMNLIYVAVTRAKRVLHYVHRPVKEN